MSAILPGLWNRPTRWWLKHRRWWVWHHGAGPSPSDVRITEDSQDRLTEDGLLRLTEGA